MARLREEQRERTLGRVQGGTSQSQLLDDLLNVINRPGVSVIDLDLVKGFSHVKSSNGCHLTLSDFAESWYITNIQTICHRKERLGGLGHGGWDICVVSAKPLPIPCLVYSLGINYNFMFDDSIATKYGCEVHSFDPKMGLGEHDHSLRVHFHPAAISNVNKMDSQGRQLYTLEEAQKRLHHQQRTIDIMKMDIGSAEWSVLEHISKTATFGSIKQLVVEFHDFQLVKGEKKFGHGSRNQYIRQLQILKQLHNAGFRIFYTETNVACKFRSYYGPEWSSCHKVGLLKVTAKQNGFLAGWLK